MSVRFLSKCSAEGAEILLQSFCEEFERCKKLEALSRVRKPVVKHQHLNQGIWLNFIFLFAFNGQ